MAGDGRGRLDVREFEPHLLDLFAAANLVIARGGYNTVLELREAGVPAICVPAERAGESQEERIRRAAETGEQIRLVGLNVDALVREIRRIAGEARWHYEPGDSLMTIQANKAALAERLIRVSMGRSSTLAA